jgi:hypothetical protein
VKRTHALDKMVELVERDHGGCDNNTCSISVALENGYSMHALEMWSGCGAADDEFNALYFPHARFIAKESRKEASLMCDKIPHVDCPHCNAVLWNPADSDYWCGSCGKTIPREVTA